MVNLNVNPNMIDANLIHNYAQVDLGGTGVQAAARAQILASPALKNNADNAPPSLWFAYINTKVKPLDNVHCRRAVEYAADKTDFQTAFGGPIAGGDIASTVLPPNLTRLHKVRPVPGHHQTHGDLAKARQELAACGQPNGFTTTLAFRTDQPETKSCSRPPNSRPFPGGINLALQGYSSGNLHDLLRRRNTYTSTTSGSPSMAGQPTGQTDSASSTT